MSFKNKEIAIIGAGISGMTVARLLEPDCKCTIFEADKTPGGLIKCKRVEGSLYHTCGGHVFNTKYPEVLDFFWSIFNKDVEFHKTDRNSSVFFENGEIVSYPIENHVYMMDDNTLKSFISDILSKNSESSLSSIVNFQEFLTDRFGITLYNKYFKPYNEKIWKRDLSNVPISWLEGKLPMPSREEMIFNNIRKIKEKKFVHSTFWYEKNDGSQFLANKLAEGLNIRFNEPVTSILKDKNEKWLVNGDKFDNVIFCGNIKELPLIFKSIDPIDRDWISRLEYHGTTTVFCEINNNPYSWIYLADSGIMPHRIICTGNFAESNNAPNKMTATVEFTDYISKDDILEQLEKTPLSPKYITHTFNKFTYPIQDKTTRYNIAVLKGKLSKIGVFMTGRFADWEYYNMDVAMKAAMDTVNLIKNHK